MDNIIYFLIGVIGTSIWLAYEAYRAPEMDNNGRIVKPGKTLKDLFKRK